MIYIPPTSGPATDPNLLSMVQDAAFWGCVCLCSTVFWFFPWLSHQSIHRHTQAWWLELLWHLSGLGPILCPQFVLSSLCHDPLHADSWFKPDISLVFLPLGLPPRPPVCSFFDKCIHFCLINDGIIFSFFIEKF